MLLLLQDLRYCKVVLNCFCVFSVLLYPFSFCFPVPSSNMLSQRALHTTQVSIYTSFRNTSLHHYFLFLHPEKIKCDLELGLRTCEVVTAL